MLYVVVREIEGGDRRENVVFSARDEAQACYDQAELVCYNDPDDSGDGDPAIVSQCWLYAANIDDPDVARAMTLNGRAILIVSYSEESFEL
jgi:hypothetical protein